MAAKVTTTPGHEEKDIGLIDRKEVPVFTNEGSIPNEMMVTMVKGQVEA